MIKKIVILRLMALAIGLTGVRSAADQEEIVFATFAEQESDLARVHIMIDSIRTFAGRFKDAPVWVYLTEGLLASESEHLEEIESLGGEFRLGQAPEEAIWFYVARKVFASAQAETEAVGKAEILAWLDPDTIFLQEPGELFLPKGKSLGYRPVIHRNISPLYSDPLDDFWKRAYRDMSIPESLAFPMVTVADGDKIRTYVNASRLGQAAKRTPGPDRLAEGPAPEEKWGRSPRCHPTAKIFYYQGHLFLIL